MKERLTGAIILVALIVLLVPELLTGPIRAKPVAAPSTPASASSGFTQTAHQPPLRSYTLTLDAAPPQVHDAPAAPAEAAAQPAAASEQSVPPTPAQSRAPSSDPSPARTSGKGSGIAARADLQAAKAPAHPTVPKVRSSASNGAWVVQLGSFASRQNAERLARSLEGRGFHLSVSPAHTRKRVLWRVRAGPAHDRDGAEHLAARLRALGHRGEVLPAR